MKHLTIVAMVGGVLTLAAAGSAMAVSSSDSITTKAADVTNTIQLADRCNRACRRGPVKEWGGVVRWHRHVGPNCRPVSCRPN
jgi:hypothetical protein